MNVSETQLKEWMARLKDIEEQHMRVVRETRALQRAIQIELGQVPAREKAVFTSRFGQVEAGCGVKRKS